MYDLFTFNVAVVRHIGLLKVGNCNCQYSSDGSTHCKDMASVLYIRFYQLNI